MAQPISLADALFTTTQKRLFALLFGQHSRSFYASELIKRTDSGSGAVQRELKRLLSSGHVTMKRIGNQKHYHDSPVFQELCSLVIKTVGLAEPLQTALAPVEAKLGRTVNPTLYTLQEFSDRRTGNNPFLSRVFEDDHLVLVGENDEPA